MGSNCKSAFGIETIGPTTISNVFIIINFRNWMNLRDADTGKILWQSNDDL
jgi:hypothetical protein